MGCLHHKNVCKTVGLNEVFEVPESGRILVSPALPMLSYKRSRRSRRCQITGYLLFRFLVVFVGMVAVTAVAASLIACTNASTIGDDFW